MDVSEAIADGGHGPAETMPAARVHGAGDLRIDQIPVPGVGETDVLVRVRACGICGSDIGFIAAGGLGGGVPLEQPLAIGHEFAGVVAAVGTKVADIQVGMRCAVNPDSGYVGCGGEAGAFAPYILVRNARLGTNICPIPESLSLDHAALAEPLSVALHGINLASPAAGSRVTILGAGPIGLSAILCLRDMGIDDIAVADLSDARLERARQLGARITINPSRQSLTEALAAAHGEGERFGMPFVATDVFLDAAGSAAALTEVLKVAKYKAKVIVIALYKKPVPVDLWKMMANEISLIGSIAADRETEFLSCLRLLSEGRLNVEPLISHRIPFDAIEEGFRIASDADASAKVMVTFPQSA